jgi:hypothetical protein
MGMGFLSLDVSAVAKAYKHARARLIVDYGGTIVSNDNVSFVVLMTEDGSPRSPSHNFALFLTQIDSLKVSNGER